MKRKIRKAYSTTTDDSVLGTHRVQTDSTIPISRPPTIAPGMLPKPPSKTVTKGLYGEDIPDARMNVVERDKRNAGCAKHREPNPERNIEHEWNVHTHQ